MKGYIFIYVLVIATVSLISYKKGNYLIWSSFLFVPTILLEQPLFMGIAVMVVLMIGSVISEMRYSKRRLLWINFFLENEKAVLLYISVSFIILFMSQTVPLGFQARSLLVEIAMFLFALQTFLLVKSGEVQSLFLRRLICCAVFFNLVYCVFFELFVGINPAGLPLYILLGVDDTLLEDMIDEERGGLSFRAQTVYSHPLSLGQYMLVILPLFLQNTNQGVKLVYTLIICCLIVMSGTRGAMVPMALLLLLNLRSSFKSILPKVAGCILILSVVVISISEKQRKLFSREIEPVVASLQFWDEDKQVDNDIKGSTMQMRFDQFDAALREIDKNPIFGLGYGYRSYYIVKHHAGHPDLLGFESVLLLYLVERGWLGLLFFFFIVYYIYKMFSSSIKDKSPIKYVFFVYLLSIIMTGVRPFTLLFVCLSCIIFYDLLKEPEQNGCLDGDNNPEEFLFFNGR